MAFYFVLLAVYRLASSNVRSSSYCPSLFMASPKKAMPIPVWDMRISPAFSAGMRKLPFGFLRVYRFSMLLLLISPDSGLLPLVPHPAFLQMSCPWGLADQAGASPQQISPAPSLTALPILLLPMAKKSRQCLTAGVPVTAPPGRNT